MDETSQSVTGTPSEGAHPVNIPDTSGAPDDEEFQYDDTILPEGWSPDDDDPLGLGVETVPEPVENTPDQSAKNSGTNPAEPTENSGQTPENQTDKSGENPAQTPDATSPQSTQDKSPEPDYKALYEARLERENADKFREIYRRLTEEDGMPESVARLAAANECGGKSYPLEADISETPASPSDTPPSPARDFSADMRRLSALYPDVTEMPESVMRAYLDGENLVSAYSSYRSAQDARTIAELRQQVQTLRQNAANAARAPVTGVSASAPEHQPDDFERGLNSDW